MANEMTGGVLGADGFLGISPVTGAQLSAAVESVPRNYNGMLSCFTRRQPQPSMKSSFDLISDPVSLINWCAFGSRGNPLSRGLLNNVTLEQVHEATFARITKADILNKRAFGASAQMTIEELSNRQILSHALSHMRSMERACFAALYWGKLVNSATSIASDPSVYKYSYPTVFAVTDDTGSTTTWSVSTATWDYTATKFLPTYLTSITDYLDQHNAQSLGWNGRLKVFMGRPEFDGFRSQALVRESINYVQMGRGIKEGMQGPEDLYKNRGDEIDTFTYANATFVRYRGNIGGTYFLPAATALVVPEGVQTNVLDFGPSDFMTGGEKNMSVSAAGGSDLYVAQWLEPDLRALNTDIQTTYLPAVLRPDFNFRVTVTNNAVS